MNYKTHHFFSCCTIFLFSWSLCLMPATAQNNGAKNVTIPFHVGVILDMESWVGKMSMSCISMAVSDFYAVHSNYTTRLVLHTRDSKNDVVVAASAALDMLNNVEVQAIMGPQKSDQVEFVADLGGKAHVPILAFSATSSSLSPVQNPYFIRTAQKDSSQVKAITAIIQAFGWKAVVLIYEDTDYGNGLIPYLMDGLHEIDARVSLRSVIPLSATDDQIARELYKLKTMQTRVFIVHMSHYLASHLFFIVKEVEMMSEGYVWIITDVLTNLVDSQNSSVIDSMQGVLGIKQYIASSKELNNFTVRWRRKFRKENPDVDRVELSAFGVRAYDTVSALAIAAERVGMQNSYFQKPRVGENTTELETIGVSHLGPKLRDAILNTEFKGLGGEFRLVNGELQSSGFQIVNVIGKGERTIGVWTPENAISRDLKINNKTCSTSVEDLRGIIWPGESSKVPKGWVIPTSGKNLRISIPIPLSFFEFLKVQRNPLTNATIATGYCIDLFEKVMEALPYFVPYELIPYQTADGKRAGGYSDLIYQVHLQKYDGMVADTTITANRSLYVDFTLPYMESGIAMIVPVMDDESNKTWIFLKPLTYDLWLTSGAFFIFTGFVVWILEHRINDEFRGSPTQQLGLIFWFSFSTLVFAQREKVKSNLARFVVTIWVFVVLVLTSSYTASLTSMLTVQQLKPTVTDIADLIKNGDYVGHQKGPYMKEFLKRFGFNQSKLKAYIAPDEYAEALSKGSRNGGIAAFFDETPYLKRFLLDSKYCTKYTMVGQTYKNGGFGFAFPKGSPLVADISRAILNVTEGDTMALIEQKWFGNRTSCSEQSTTITSGSLTLDSFRGLFLIAGIASVSALFIFAVSFLHEQRKVLIETNGSNSSFRQRLATLASRFDQKDLSAGTLKSSNPNSGIAMSASPFQPPSAGSQAFLTI